jgi:flagellar basal-body rod protein FlgG
MFEDLLYQTIVQPGGLTSQQSESPTGLNLGTGVRVVATDKQFAQGNLINSNNDLDLAIKGRGFFEILLPDGGQAYTRDGTFQMDRDSQMATSSGYTLQPAITIPPGTQTITIGVDGVVTVVLPGSPDSVQIGTLQLVDFFNPPGLQPLGENLYQETISSGPPQSGTPGLNGLGTVVQGALETSNVNVVEEFVNMIESQRAYEMSSRAISTSDEMLRYITNNL